MRSSDSESKEADRERLFQLREHREETVMGALAKVVEATEELKRLLDEPVDIFNSIDHPKN